MILRTASIATSLVLAASSSAFAADHAMKVGEILTSNGSTTSQFVELQDPGESFPSPPYSIEVFNAAGTSVGTQTLVVPSGTTRFLVATAQAQTDFSVTAQAILTVALPSNGQVCFKRSSARIHCFGWGTITSTVIGNTMDAGPAPTDGQSVQRTTAGYQVATPTPGAANVAQPIVDGPPDAGVVSPDANGVVPDAGNGNPDPDKDDGGCDIGGGASWFALIGLAALALMRRSARR